MPPRVRFFSRERERACDEKLVYVKVGGGGGAAGGARGYVTAAGRAGGRGRAGEGSGRRSGAVAVQLALDDVLRAEPVLEAVPAHEVMSQKLAPNFVLRDRRGARKNEQAGVRAGWWVRRVERRAGGGGRGGGDVDRLHLP
ncbi:hypothetical protein FGB62_108g19 [Gracilaria domingensis]|nr:hypothetical protein FGB62_108g19 [Gracilaria domingensis]